MSCTGLNHIHSGGHSHFAINLTNILIVRRCGATKFVLGEFGLDLHSDQRKESRAQIGGPHTRFIAPEVFNKEGNKYPVRYYDKEALMSDIFSLGMIFKEVRKNIGNSWK